MIEREILHKAKEFLCWDKFPGLAIQLVESESPVSYFLPPSDICTIMVFIKTEGKDYIFSLFQLFHEAGHQEQYRKYEEENRSDEFWEIINKPSGRIKVEFETQAWHLGQSLIYEFKEKYRIKSKLLEDYLNYSEICIKTYGVGEEV